MACPLHRQQSTDMWACMSATACRPLPYVDVLRCLRVLMLLVAVGAQDAAAGLWARHAQHLLRTAGVRPLLRRRASRLGRFPWQRWSVLCSDCASLFPSTRPRYLYPWRIACVWLGLCFNWNIIRATPSRQLIELSCALHLAQTPIYFGTGFMCPSVTSALNSRRRCRLVLDVCGQHVPPVLPNDKLGCPPTLELPDAGRGRDHVLCRRTAHAERC